MTIKESVKAILKNIGGNKNVKSVSHCMSRLRFELYNESIVDDDVMKAIPGVVGIVHQGNQYQVIIGPNVSDYFQAFMKLGDFHEVEFEDNEVSSKAEKKTGKYFLKKIIEYISGSMTPVIAPILGGGMIKVILVILTLTNVLKVDTKTYQIISVFGDAPFYFLPILLAYSAAKKMNVNPFLAVSIGGVLLHPSFTALINSGDSLSVMGLPVTDVNYGSSVLPILIIVWVMKYVEKVAHKIIPGLFKSFGEPLFILFVSGILAVVAVGPLGTFAGEVLSTFIFWLNDKVGWLATGIMGAIFPFTVMGGLHWAFGTVFLRASVEHPDVLVMPAMLASNVAQGAVALAIAIKAKNKGLKQISVGAAISALMAGISEPALFGITLKYRRALYAVMIAGGIAGAYSGITGVTGYAFSSPSLLAIPVYAGGGNNSSLINAIITAGISILVSFVLIFVFGIDEEKEEKKISNESEMGGIKIYAPLEGKVIPIESVKDPVFSEKMMGNGIAIVPEDDKIYAPFDGIITTIFPTNHAIGITSKEGNVELLIHIGLDTVKLKGEFFENLVKVGDEVTKGQIIMKVDFNQLKKMDYDITTPVIIMNSKEFEISNSDVKNGEVLRNDGILDVVRLT